MFTFANRIITTVTLDFADDPYLVAVLAFLSLLRLLSLPCSFNECLLCFPLPLWRRRAELETTSLKQC